MNTKFLILVLVFSSLVSTAALANDAITLASGCSEGGFSVGISSDKHGIVSEAVKYLTAAEMQREDKTGYPACPYSLHSFPSKVTYIVESPAGDGQLIPYFQRNDDGIRRTGRGASLRGHG